MSLSDCGDNKYPKIFSLTSLLKRGLYITQAAVPVVDKVWVSGSIL